MNTRVPGEQEENVGSEEDEAHEEERLYRGVPGHRRTRAAHEVREQRRVRQRHHPPEDVESEEAWSSEAEESSTKYSTSGTSSRQSDHCKD